MKPINFLDSLSLSQKREITIFSWLSLVIGSCLLIGIIGQTSMQWLYYMQLSAKRTNKQREISNFEQTIGKKRNLKVEKSELDKKFFALERYKNNPKNPVHVLTSVRSQTKELAIESIAINQKKIELQATCSSPEQVAICLRNLSKIPELEKLKLIDLQAQANKITATYSGQVKNKLRKRA